MDRVAENGIAAHWKYKAANPLDTTAQSKAREWLANIQEIQGSSHAEEFLESVKVDLYPDKVYVFSPKGDILRLPSKSTCVDFAYAVHTKVGDSVVACEINGRGSPLQSLLKNGDMVKVIGSNNVSPSLQWLSYAKTGKARASIRKYWQNKTNSKHASDKKYISYTGYPGGQRVKTAQQLYDKNPSIIVEKAVKGMLPKNKLGAAIFKNLRVYNDELHKQESQSPESINLNNI